MSVEKKAPEIRFKAFDTNWVNYNLSQVTDVYDGTHQTPKYTKSGVMFLSAENIKSLTSKKFISQKAFEREFDVYPQQNDVLMTRIGDVGTANVVETNEKRAYYVTLALLKYKNLSPYFLKSSISSPFVQRDIWLRTLHIAFPKKINMNEIKQVSINCPSEPSESEEIGNYFQKLDSLINQHQQKHDKLSHLKKAMLENMFPKKGKTVPEIRFKGFSGEWVSASLSKVANKYDNLRIPVTAKDRISGNTPYYGANGIQSYIEGYTHDGEYVLLAEDGANDLKNYPIHYVNGKVWVNNHAHVLKAKEMYSNLFLKYALVSIDFEPFLVGGGRAKLNASVMMDLEITFTENIEEQTQIGNYFQKLDTLIDQHQQQITKLNNIKQACLSKMFV
ncbi:restriction endonuclease subunit S [Vibrio artabrorum]|uniref:restriction endonuclease subunit S n=1 Tax=Vibrio artabrorum TaxID=446374 RepID=UPI00354D31CA